MNQPVSRIAAQASRASLEFARGLLDQGGTRPQDPPRLSGGLPLVGHMIEFSKNPFETLMRARREGGEVVELKLLNQAVVMLTGPEANQAFLRAPDDQICRREAYKIMTPIFGKGVMFDAPLPVMNQQMRMIMPMLRDKVMRSYPPVITRETKRLSERWGTRGDLDVLEFMKELTIYTSTHCLVGEEFRGGITEEFFAHYHDLEKGLDPLAYLFPNLPIPKFRRRDAARSALQERIARLMQGRLGQSNPPHDGLQMLMEAQYQDGSRLSADEVTGILIALILAGHHTSAGTATWVLVELLRNPKYLGPVVDEIDRVIGDATELTYPMLREMTSLGAVIKETLRLHPPLIFLFRKVLRRFEYNGYVVEPGKMLCAAPAVTHRMEEVFPNAERFDPERYQDQSQNDPNSWIAFGGGKHKCTGNAFGTLQLKAIIATLLRNWEFELKRWPAEYRDDYNKPTVLPRGPCLLGYKQRTRPAKAPAEAAAEALRTGSDAIDHMVGRKLRVVVDRHLCQGHAVCVSEAPGVFAVSEHDSVTDVLLDDEKANVRRTAETTTFDVPAELNERVVCAAKFCPNQALAVEERE